MVFEAALVGYFIPSRQGSNLGYGANIGAFTVYAAYKAPKAQIIAYEPVGYVFDRLSKQVSFNRLENRVSLINAAVGATDGYRNIFVGGSDAVASFIPRKGTYRQVVRVESIGKVLDRVGRCPVSLLKLDCEGAEWEILPCLTKEMAKQIDRICLEYHPVGGKSINELVQIMRELGFSLILLRLHRGPVPGVAWFQRCDL